MVSEKAWQPDGTQSHCCLVDVYSPKCFSLMDVYSPNSCLMDVIIGF